MSRKRRRTLPAGDLTSGILLWAYVLLLAFVWHGARLTPDGAVLIRLMAAILCDLVWIPLGFMLWFGLLHWVFRLILRPSGRLERLAAALAAALGAAAMVLGFMDTAFALMAIPLPVFLVRFLARSMRGGQPRAVAQRMTIAHLPLFLILLLTGLHYGRQLIPLRASPWAASSLRVMTYNIYSDGDREMRERAVAEIRREAPDILFLQELRSGECEFLFRRELWDLYPYMLTTAGRVRWAGDIVAIMSRYPLTLFSPEEPGPGETGTRRILLAVLEVEGRRICVACVHLQSGGRGLEDAARRRLSPGETVEQISPLERSAETIRRRHAAWLADTAAATGLPVIMAGDFNDTPNSRVYRMLDERMDNAFAVRGRGLGSTFGESWIVGKRRLREIPLAGLLARDLLRIDHVFVSRDLQILSARVVRDALGSDHKPVVVDIGLDRLEAR